MAETYPIIRFVLDGTPVEFAGSDILECNVLFGDSSYKRNSASKHCISKHFYHRPTVFYILRWYFLQRVV